VRAWLAVGVAQGAVACHPPAIVRYEDTLETTPPPAAHGVHEQRLALLMRDLGRLRDERLPQQIDPADMEAHQAREVAGVARALADSAAHIADAVPEGLDPSERAGFLALAESLRTASLDLARDAAVLPAAGLQSKLAAIDATCDACHSRFRIPESPDGGG
jgi:hypothetical protein